MEISGGGGHRASANGYPFSDIPTDKWFIAPSALYNNTGMCENGAHLSFIGMYMCEKISILIYTCW